MTEREAEASASAAPWIPGSRRGRRPNPSASSAILEATRQELAEKGVRGLTVEGVALRSGIAKTTIYRRWRSKEDLALAVLVEMVEAQVVSVRDRDDTRAELIALVWTTVRSLASTVMGRVIQGLISDLTADPVLARAFRERVVKRRAEELARILRRGVERGNIRADVDTDFSTELLFGPITYRLFFGGKTLTKDFAIRIVDAFMAYAGVRRDET